MGWDTRHDGTQKFHGDVEAAGDFGAVKKIRQVVRFSEMTDVTTTGTYELPDTPTNCLLVGIAHRPVEAFEGGVNATFAFDLGDGSNADRFIDAADVATASSTWVREAPDAFGDGADVAGLPLQITTAITPTLTVTVDDDFTDVTAGAIEVEMVFLVAGTED